MRRLMREIAELQSNPPEGIRVVAGDDNMLDVTGIIEGPGALWSSSTRVLQLTTLFTCSYALSASEGTPYAGGYFKVKFNFTEEFPATPPKCWSQLAHNDVVDLLNV